MKADCENGSAPLIFKNSLWHFWRRAQETHADVGDKQELRGHTLELNFQIVQRLLKAITLATAATVVLPFILVVIVSTVSEAMSFAQGVAFVVNKAGDFGSILLVLNLIVVFLGLSVPEIVMDKSRRHQRQCEPHK